MTMMFTRYREAEKRSGSLLDVEWHINEGGFLHLGQNNWTFSHRFATKGSVLVGQQKEFLMRFQIALDNEPRFSWLTFECINPFEARLFYFWLKVWPGRNFKLVVNFGWTLSRESRRVLQNQIVEYERRQAREFKQKAQAVQNGGGLSDAS